MGLALRQRQTRVPREEPAAFLHLEPGDLRWVRLPVRLNQLVALPLDLQILAQLLPELRELSLLQLPRRIQVVQLFL